MRQETRGKADRSETPEPHVNNSSCQEKKDVPRDSYVDAFCVAYYNPLKKAGQNQKGTTKKQEMYIAGSFGSLQKLQRTVWHGA